MSQTLSDESLLLRLYDDASSGRGLQSSLADTAASFNATVAHLLASDASTQVPRWDLEADLSQGVHAASTADYVAHHWRIDPRRRGMALLSPGSAWRCQRIVAADEAARSEFFQDFFRPLDLRWSMVGRLPLPSATGVLADEVVDLALVRSPRAGGFSDTDQQRFERFLPHLRRALSVQQRLADCESGHRALGAAALGSLVLDAQLRPVGSTPGTLQQLGAQLGSLRFGAAALRRSPAALDQALRDTLADGHPRHVGLGPGQGPPERVWLSITRRRLQGRTELLVLVRWPDRRHTLQPEALMQLFQLTRREAEMGCALLEGRSPREMWTERGLSAATVRSQLSALYAKTGTKGQVDFVRLVAPLAAGPGP